MPTPHIGRGLAVTLIAILVAWMAFRTVGARPPATPNSAMPQVAVDAPLAASKGTQNAVFAGGCFWGVQAVFQHLKGVTSATSGYSGGFVKDPSYETVSLGFTEHAESVRVAYDPSQISYGQLLMVYFSVAHDPTQYHRQGPDYGTQYRSAIFYSSDEQKRIAESYVAQLNAAKVYLRPIVTEIVAFDAFYPAEDYHQDYLKRHPDNPYIVMNDLPKLDQLKQRFPDLYRSN
jgi:peptide-methionine (S)-S-oxide reductase